MSNDVSSSMAQYIFRTWVLKVAYLQSIAFAASSAASYNQCNYSADEKFTAVDPLFYNVHQ